VRVGRLLGAFAVLVIMTSTGQPGARAASSGGTTIGPVQISALGHPGLCWQAGGNGSGVTLEHCDRVLQGQQWSLTPDGVLMNGNGYCLEAVPGRPLFIDFAAQCAGASSQLWQHHSGQLTSSVTGASTTGAGAGVCAVTAAPVSPGAEIVGGYRIHHTTRIHRAVSPVGPMSTNSTRAAALRAGESGLGHRGRPEPGQTGRMASRDHGRARFST
jgi:hypothetical protein